VAHGSEVALLASEALDCLALRVMLDTGDAAKVHMPSAAGALTRPCGRVVAASHAQRLAVGRGARVDGL
jgi:hypothetical protein